MEKYNNEENKSLRHKAEELLSDKLSKRDPNLSEADTLKLTHELEVHQIELEMQNEELNLAKENSQIAVDKYQDLFDFAPLGYLTFNKDASILEINLNAAKMLGEERSSLINSNFGFFVSDDTKPIFWHFIDNVFKSNTPASCEIELSIKTETPIYVLLSGIASENRNQCFVSAVDITERKVAEERLKESHTLLRIAEEKAHIGGWSVILAENRSYWSDEVAAIHEMPAGYSPLVEDGINFYAPEWRDRIAEVFTKCAQEGIPYDEEMQIITSTGKRVWVQTIGEAVRNDKGEIYKVHGAFQDITERKLAEDALKDSFLSYKILANSGQALIWTSGKDKLCNYFNDVWLKFTGRTLEEELGTGWTEGVHPDDRQVCMNTYIEAFERREKFSMLYRVKRHDGVYRWIQDDGSPRYNIKGDFAGYIGHCLDVTERKQAEEEILMNTQRVETLLELNQMTQSGLEEITDFAMEEAIRFTKSKIGYVAFLNADDSVLTMPSWSKTAMAECAISNTPMEFPVEKTGLWGEAVRQRKPIITNDYNADNPFKKGIPEGHVHLSRHLNIPIFAGSKIVLVIGVGNKETDYNQDDVRQLTLLMEGMWNLIERRRSNETLQDIIDKNPMSIQIVDYGGYTLKTNPANTALFGAVPPPDFSIFDDIQNKSEELEKLILLAKSGEVVQLPDIHYNAHDVVPSIPDNPKWIRAIIFPLKDSHGKPDRFVLMHEDITERKNAEEQIQKISEHYQALIEKAPDGIVLIDANGDFKYVSPSARKMFGYSTTEEISGSPARFTHPEDLNYVLSNLAQIYKNSNFSPTLQYRFLEKNGNWVWVESTFTNLFADSNVDAIVINFRNISERKQAEDALIEKAEQLQRFNDLMVGREMKMVELKREINALCKRLGEPEKYVVHHKEN